MSSAAHDGPHAFMSHDHADKAHHLIGRLQLRRQMEAAGIRMFISDLAVDGRPQPAANETTIEVGQRYPEVLDERLRTASCIVTFLSRAYFRKLRSASADGHGLWIQKEWESASVLAHL